MGDKMSSLRQNYTWELVQPSTKKKFLQNKWVYRVKHEVNGTKRFKDRLIVKGFSEKKF